MFGASLVAALARIAFFARTALMPNAMLALVGYAFVSFTLLYVRYDRFESMSRWSEISSGTLTLDLLPTIWYANILFAASISLWLGSVLRERIQSPAILLIPEARESVALGVVLVAVVPIGAAFFLSRSGPWQQLAPAFCATALAVYTAGISFRSTREDLWIVAPMALVALATVFAPRFSRDAAEANLTVFVSVALLLSVLLLLHALSRETWRLRVMQAIEKSGETAEVREESAQLPGDEVDHQRDATAFSETLSLLYRGSGAQPGQRIWAWIRTVIFFTRHGKSGEYIGARRLALLAILGVLPAAILPLVWGGPQHLVPAVIMVMAFWDSPLDVPGVRNLPRSMRARFVFWSAALRTLVTALYGLAVAHVVARPLLALGWNLMQRDWGTTIDKLGITTLGMTSFVVALLPVFYMLRAFVLAKGSAALYPHSKNVRRGFLLVIGWILVVPVPALLALGYLRPGQPDILMRHLILITGSYLVFYGVLGWRYARMDLARTG